VENPNVGGRKKRGVADTWKDHTVGAQAWLLREKKKTRHKAVVPTKRKKKSSWRPRREKRWERVGKLLKIRARGVDKGNVGKEGVRSGVEGKVHYSKGRKTRDKTELSAAEKKYQLESKKYMI